MHWKVKAVLQNAVAILPSRLSYEVYYQLQRRFGGLRHIRPEQRLVAAVQTWKRLLANGMEPVGKTFLEVGTGRLPLVPLAYWLMGAGRVHTVDLNPYLKGELLAEAVAAMLARTEHFRALFGGYLLPSRWSQLEALRPASEIKGQRLEGWTRKFLEETGITYQAPADACELDLPDNSIDAHTSYTVFEHIPREVLLSILKEARRILRPEGLCVHCIDYSDHFSHSDPRLSPIHFLRYDDATWARYADNRYMYMNRMRHDDYLALLTEAGHTLCQNEPEIDPRALSALESPDFTVAPRFRQKSREVLATRGAWITSRPSG